MKFEVDFNSGVYKKLTLMEQSKLPLTLMERSGLPLNKTEMTQTRQEQDRNDLL